MRRLIVTFSVVLATASQMAFGQGRVDKNVVYGMYSGLGLLMDVYRPAQPNGIAIVAVQGSGWYSPMRYDASQLKANREVTRNAERFAEAGYTVFAINHRQAPRFRYPAPIEDAQRAVRFVRFQASAYGITSERIGAWGSSSGGHIVELLGALDGKGDAGFGPGESLERKGTDGSGIVRAQRSEVGVQHHVPTRSAHVAHGLFLSGPCGCRSKPRRAAGRCREPAVS
jgi:hypothetical protein